MNPEYPQPNEGEFKFGSDLEFNAEAEKIAGQLTPFLGADLANKTSEYLKDAAKRIDGTIKELLTQGSVRDEYRYDGSVFDGRNNTSMIVAPNGLEMLRQTTSVHIKSFFGSTVPTNPAPDRYMEKLKDMFDFMSTNYIDNVLGMQERVKSTGRANFSLKDLKVEDV